MKELALVLFGWAYLLAPLFAVIWWVSRLARQARPKRKPVRPKGRSAFFKEETRDG